MRCHLPLGVSVILLGILLWATASIANDNLPVYLTGLSASFVVAGAAHWTLEKLIAFLGGPDGEERNERSGESPRSPQGDRSGPREHQADAGRDPFAEAPGRPRRHREAARPAAGSGRRAAHAG